MKFLPYAPTKKTWQFSPGFSRRLQCISRGHRDRPYTNPQRKVRDRMKLRINLELEIGNLKPSSIFPNPSSDRPIPSSHLPKCSRNPQLERFASQSISTTPDLRTICNNPPAIQNSDLSASQNRPRSPVFTAANHSHSATFPLRSDRFAKCAADAELTPASTGHRGCFRLRMHSIQFVKCNNSPSG